MNTRDITSAPAVEFIPARHRAEKSKAFAAGVEVYAQMEDRLERVEALLAETQTRSERLVVRNEFLEQQNARLERLYGHHAKKRIECASGIKNILDLVTAIAIREEIDLNDPHNKGADDVVDESAGKVMPGAVGMNQ